LRLTLWPFRSRDVVLQSRFDETILGKPKKKLPILGAMATIARIIISRRQGRPISLPKFTRVVSLLSIMATLSLTSPVLADESKVVAVLSGNASWYGPGFNGKKAASGQIFDENAMTAAHRSLPFGTQVRVINQANGKSVVVRINDRGPFHKRRIIDLSKAAAAAIGIQRAGVGAVRLEVMGK